MTLNTVAVAPMPRANERIDTTAKPGAMRNCRTTCRISIERLTNGAISIVSYSRRPVYTVGLRSPGDVQILIGRRSTPKSSEFYTAVTLLPEHRNVVLVLGRDDTCPQLIKLDC